MLNTYYLYMSTPLAQGLKALLKLLVKKLALNNPIEVYLAGGMAVHLYVAQRITTDVDAEFTSRIAIPRDLIVQVQLEDGSLEEMYWDTNYNPDFALNHEDYLADAIRVEFGVEPIEFYVLSPLDLAVSKIARFSDNDREDIRSLVQAGLTSADLIEKRAQEALGGFVGNVGFLQLNLRDAVALAREAEQQQSRQI
jgi:hypothetical protein